MSRLTHVSYEQMSDEQKAMVDLIAKNRTVKDGHVGGPHDVWLLNAEMAKRIMGLGDMFRFRTSVDRRYVELAILVTGQFWAAQYEWYAHEPMAREAGVPESVIRAIHQGEEPDFDDDADRATWQLCRELHNDHQVSDETFKLAVNHFGEQGVAEIVCLIGYYTMVSMSLNAFQVPLPEGAEYPF